MNDWDTIGLIFLILVFIGWGVHQYFDVYLPDLREERKTK